MTRKKYEETPNLFSYRRDRKTWSRFTLIAKIKGTTPTEIFDKTVDDFLAKNRVTFEIEEDDSNDAGKPNTGTTATDSDDPYPDDPLLAGTPNAETLGALREVEEGNLLSFDSKDKLFKFLHS
jgi:hypothetical protein